MTDPANSYRCETCGACALYKFSENDHEAATYNRAYANALRSVSEYLAFHGSEGLTDWLIRRERAFTRPTRVQAVPRDCVCAAVGADKREHVDGQCVPRYITGG